MSQTSSSLFRLPDGISKHLGRVIPAVVLAFIATYVLNWMGILHSLERRILDFEMTGKPACSSNHDGDHCPIVLVIVDDDSYGALFQRRSPLDAGKLQKLIAAIAAQEPRVIAVDIDTSDPQFRGFDPRFKGSSQRLIPVIWERVVWPPDAKETKETSPFDVWGGRDRHLNLSSGIAALFDDPVDNVTRSYMRCIETKAGDIPSFVFAAASAYRYARDVTQSLCREAPDRQFRLIGFSSIEGAFESVLASTVLDAKAHGSPLVVLKDRLVILGGTYGATDRHSTPIGEQRGINILANAVQTELRGPEILAPSDLTVLLAEFVVTITLIIGICHFKPPPSLMVMVAAALCLLMAMIFRFTPLGSVAGLVALVPTILAVLLVGIFEYLQHEASEKVMNTPDDHRS